MLLSTHQTEDVAALCDRVVVLDAGRVRFDGPVLDLVATAAGRVWLADAPDPARAGLLAHRDRAAPQRRRAAPPGAERPSRPWRTPTCCCSASAPSPQEVAA